MESIASVVPDGASPDSPAVLISGQNSPQIRWNPLKSEWNGLERRSVNDFNTYYIHTLNVQSCVAEFRINKLQNFREYQSKLFSSIVNRQSKKYVASWACSKNFIQLESSLRILFLISFIVSFTLPAIALFCAIVSIIKCWDICDKDALNQDVYYSSRMKRIVHKVQIIREEDDIVVRHLLIIPELKYST